MFESCCAVFCMALYKYQLKECRKKCGIILLLWMNLRD
uniref:Uncharacterized protein n=1 Tax=Podoviridae sp. ctcKt3 TaxID=2826566 RepID=A0A8S5N6V9_9CAUD|nr:MAG TPA: hypothetical protein [Podoviridae sp. ctcKt3]